MTFRIRVAPEGRWETDLHVGVKMGGEGGQDLRADLESHQQTVRMGMREDLAQWLDPAPKLTAEREGLEAMYQGSLADLAARRYSRGRTPIGCPSPVCRGRWGCADARVMTCLQTMAFTPELTPATLRMLAFLQGAQLDDAAGRGARQDPGPPPLRRDRAFGDRANALYYGAADTSPLFVVLLDEYERWSGDADLVRELRHPARMALDWIDEYGDLTGDGYVRYQRRNERDGAVNQCWKDSPDSITGADDGNPHSPAPPVSCRATRTTRSGARPAGPGVLGHPAYADRLEREAAALKERFNRDFWLPHREYYALALDPYGEPVDALASNMGHLLWSGIVADDRAEAVAEHLAGPRLFSGWGRARSPPGSARTTRWAPTWGGVAGGQRPDRRRVAPLPPRHARGQDRARHLRPGADARRRGAGGDRRPRARPDEVPVQLTGAAARSRGRPGHC